ncbi:MAG: pilus assembly protein HicB [Candidatus Binatia bacterium]
MNTSDKYHKLVEWNEEDQVYLGKYLDLLTDLHGDDPIQVYVDSCQVVEEIIRQFESKGRVRPPPRVRPMQESA